MIPSSIIESSDVVVVQRGHLKLATHDRSRKARLLVAGDLAPAVTGSLGLFAPGLRTVFLVDAKPCLNSPSKVQTNRHEFVLRISSNRWQSAVRMDPQPTEVYGCGVYAGTFAAFERERWNMSVEAFGMAISPSETAFENGVNELNCLSFYRCFARTNPGNRVPFAQGTVVTKRSVKRLPNRCSTADSLRETLLNSSAAGMFTFDRAFGEYLPEWKFNRWLPYVQHRFAN